MWSKTITPTSRQLTVEIPDAFLNQPVEETRRKQIDAFFDQFQADVSLLRFSREELYER